MRGRGMGDWSLAPPGGLTRQASCLRSRKDACLPSSDDDVLKEEWPSPGSPLHGRPPRPRPPMPSATFFILFLGSMRLNWGGESFLRGVETITVGMLGTLRQRFLHPSSATC